MKIERQLQGTLNNLFHQALKDRGLDDRIQVVTEEGRADITLKNVKKGNNILFVELKDPKAKDGKSVFDGNVFLREIERAFNQLEVSYFGICNFISAAFFKLPKQKGEALNFEKSAVYDNLPSLADLELLRQRYVITKDIETRLLRLANWYIDKAVEIIEKKAVTFSPPDEIFIYAIRKLIERYAFDVTADVWKEYNSNKNFNKEIKKYAHEQKWNQPSSIEEIEKITHISLLMLVSKIIFYKACRPAFKGLPEFSIELDNQTYTAHNLKEKVWEYFETFKDITNDFELLIGQPEDIVFQLPFVSETTIEFVAYFLETSEIYDFSKTEYDIIGRIFEELIRPDERHKLGQYFTPPQVIDFINSFCIRDKNDKVLDPSCGSGTFLVRAYHRKKDLGLHLHHRLLSDIYGSDISGYAAYLAMLNLSIRDIRKPSYPQIIHKDFFFLFTNTKQKFHDFNGVEIKKNLPQFDAIVGNPPYTRQEDINYSDENVKGNIITQVQTNWGFTPSQRTSIYGYFFYHATEFLKEGGMLGFIVSNSWLDVEYGAEMQAFFLQHFLIVAIIESKVERFFPSADVNTNIVILQKCSDAKLRQQQNILFAYLDKPLSELIKRHKTTDNLVTILKNAYPKKISHNIIPPPYFEGSIAGVKWVNQLFLATTNHKWSTFLKAPPIYFEIMEKAKDKFVPLKTIATIKFGIKTGCNEYFYGENVTENLSDTQMIGIVNNLDGLSSVKQIKQAGLVAFKNGINEIWLIEEGFVSKCIKSTKSLNSYSIHNYKTNDVLLCVGLVDEYFVDYDNSQTFYKRKQYNIDQYREDIQNEYPYLWEYIQRGETIPLNGQLVSERPSCKGRPAWWDLGKQGTNHFILLRFRDKRNWTPLLNQRILVGDTLFIGKYKDKSKANQYNIWLNSCFNILQTELMGRVNLGDGLLTTYGPDLEALNVLNIPDKNIDNKVIREIENINLMLKSQSIASIFEELGNQDINSFDIQKVIPFRYQLDALTIKLLGYDNTKEVIDNILIQLYKATLTIINDRLHKAKSLDAVKQKRQVTAFEVYVNSLTEMLTEANAKPSNTEKFAKLLETMVKNISVDIKLQNKLLNHYWKQQFNAKFDMKAIIEASQGTLF